MVRAGFVQRFRGSDIKELRVTDIQYMQTVKDKMVERLTINIDADSMDATVVSDLVSVLQENGGNTELYFQIVDSKSPKAISLRSPRAKVSLSRELLSFIKGKPCLSYKVN